MFIVSIIFVQNNQKPNAATRLHQPQGFSLLSSCLIIIHYRCYATLIPLILIGEKKTVMSTQLAWHRVTRSTVPQQGPPGAVSSPSTELAGPR